METYQFSQVHKATAVAFSPGSTFIATALHDQIFVRSSSSLQIVKVWVCNAPEPPTGTSSSSRQGAATTTTIDHLQWSPSGSRILAFSSKASCAWVLDLSKDDLVCRLTGDLVEVGWAGDDVLSWSDRGLAIHDLRTGGSRFIQTGSHHAHTWSPDHRYLAVLERHYAKDYVGVYDKESLTRNFALPSGEPRGISWSPCGKWLAVWDWHLSYAIHFFSPVGAHLGTYSPSTQHEHDYGICTVEWAPNGRHLAVGNTAGSVTVIESESWSPISTLRMNGRNVPPTWHEPAPGRKGIQQFYSGSPVAHYGPVTTLGFSPDGTLLFFGQENSLHVYEFLVDATSHPEIAPAAAVSFSAPIKAVECCPTTVRLAVVTRSRSLYLWDRLGVEGVDIPDSGTFTAVDVKWSPDGHAAAVCDRQAFCVVYEDAGDGIWEEDL